MQAVPAACEVHAAPEQCQMEMSSPSGAVITSPPSANESVDAAHALLDASMAPLSDDMSDWMAHLPDELPLAEVTMPGTHNSAAFAIGAGHMSAVVSAARCQTVDLSSQFRMGIRFLDLRVRSSDGQLCHGRVSCTLSLREAFAVCTAFLRAHPGEVVIVRVKDERGGGSTTAQGVGDLVMALAESADFPLYLQRRVPATLKEVRGRIVLLCDWADGHLGLQWGGESMILQDKYWLNSGTKKWQVIRRHFAKAIPSPDHIHVHFTSATYLPRKVPISIARTVNPRLAIYLLCGARRYRFLGIVAMDFPSPSLCKLVLRCNWRGLDPCRPLGQSIVHNAELYNLVDNLQCELAASAARADIADEHARADGASAEDHEQYAVAARWLSRVYTKLSYERAGAEISEPAVDEPIALLQTSPEVQISGDAKANGINGTPSRQEPPLPPSTSETAKSGGGFLRRLTRCGPWTSGSKRDLEDCEALIPEDPQNPHTPESLRNKSKGVSLMGSNSDLVGLEANASDVASDVSSSDEDACFFDFDGNEFLDNLQCELVAAASRADAAVLVRPAELEDRVQWLSRVLVHLTVERVQREQRADRAALRATRRRSHRRSSNGSVDPSEMHKLEGFIEFNPSSRVASLASQQNEGKSAAAAFAGSPGESGISVSLTQEDTSNPAAYARRSHMVDRKC